MNPNHLKVTHTLTSGREWTTHAHSAQVMQMLGLQPGGHLPPEGMSPRIVQGIKVWVEPEPMVRTFNRAAGIKQGKSSAHRVMAECPQCGWTGSAGRLHQHVCKQIDVQSEVRRATVQCIDEQRAWSEYDARKTEERGESTFVAAGGK